jgi:ABC-type multidrug transport system fused ATPase/permease subunit
LVWRLERDRRRPDPRRIFRVHGGDVPDVCAFQGLSRTYTAVHQGLAGAERVFEMLDEKPDIVDKPDAQTAKPLFAQDRVSECQLCLRGNPGPEGH